MIAVQAFFNISVVLGLLPTKGIPLPFVSNGGSSLLINLIGMGILLNISQHASTSHVVTSVTGAAAGNDGGCMSPLRVVIAGGGTGGHLYPGHRVAREMLRAAAGRGGVVRRHRARHRGARGAAGGLRAGRASQRRA